MIYKVEYSGVAIVEADDLEDVEEIFFDGFVECDTRSVDCVTELNDCQLDAIDVLYLDEL